MSGARKFGDALAGLAASLYRPATGSEFVIACHE